MIDVITLTRDHPAYLLTALPSMAVQGVEYQGYLVDNSEFASSRAVNQAIAKRYGWRYLSAFENVTFSRAHNWAARAGTSEDLLLLNDDARLHPGCVKALMDHADAALVGALITNDDGTINHAGVVWTDQPRGFHHAGRGEPPDYWEGLCGVTTAVTFAVALTRRIAWEHFGGLDEMFEWSFEDTDYCLKLLESGAKVVTCRKARVTHNEFGTRTTANDGRNANLLAGKWFGARRLVGEWQPEWTWDEGGVHGS